MTTSAPQITPEFQQAYELLEHSERNLFLTGRAGTGKSTFLQWFRANTTKRVAVVAPTGVAALNVGGQTVHSFFRLPPKFIHIDDIERGRMGKILHGIDMLIIDEISMVRADLFDGIVRSLQLNGPNTADPFGGIQLCVIGDLFQLPPIVAYDQLAHFSQFYSSPFFFAAKSYMEAEFEGIELENVFRQENGTFIQLLNHVREGHAKSSVITALNERVIGKENPPDHAITLTARAQRAESINSQKLENLGGNLHEYTGKVTGDFGLNGERLPAPMELRLKVGAQVMFTRNDNTNGQWVNGTLGTITTLTEDNITVEIDGQAVNVEPVKWEMLGYQFNKEIEQLEEFVKGRYTQYPLTLAWAVTIHKSQGKTLENVVIDLGSGGAFAPGQLYVALSRCRSLEKLHLQRPITPRDIHCDSRVVDYHRAQLRAA